MASLVPTRPTRPGRQVAGAHRVNARPDPYCSPVNRTVRDGVAVLWQDAPGPFSAAVVVGMGARDETLRRRQICHLIEHLAMEEHPRLPFAVDATVTLDATIFTASGPREGVLAFVEQTCRILSDLPLDRLHTESVILGIEDAEVVDPIVGLALAQHLGSRGAGLAGIGDLGSGLLDAPQVREWLARFVTRDNCIVVMTGEPPAELALDLPAGPRPERDNTRPDRAFQPARPCVRLDCSPVPFLSWVNTWDTAEDLPSYVGVLLAGVLRERAHRTLRREEAIAYAIDQTTIGIGPGSEMSVVYLGTEEDDAHARAASFLWQQLGDIADNGPQPDELNVVIGQLRHDLLEETDVRSRLVTTAIDLLSGRSEEDLSRSVALERLTDADLVRGAAVEARQTAIVGLPDAQDPNLGLRVVDEDAELVERVPYGDESFGRRRLMPWAARETRVGVSGISVRDRDGWDGAAWSRVVAVGLEDGARTVFLDNGHVIPVLLNGSQDRQRLAARIDELAGDLLFPFDIKTLCAE